MIGVHQWTPILGCYYFSEKRVNMCNTKAYRVAIRKHVDRYMDLLSELPLTDEVTTLHTSNTHIKSVLEKIIFFLSSGDLSEVMKVSRWIGYVQGVLAARRCVNMDEEMAFSRECFQPQPKEVLTPEDEEELEDDLYTSTKVACDIVHEQLLRLVALQDQLAAHEMMVATRSKRIASLKEDIDKLTALIPKSI